MDTQLSIEEKAEVRRTWDIIRKNLKENGMEIFIAMFKTDPGKQHLYKRFGCIPIHKLKSNKAFVAQSTLVMASLDDILSQIEKPVVMKEKMVQLGRHHKAIKSRATPRDFKDLNNTILDLLPVVLGTAWTKHSEQGWKKVLSMLLANITFGLET